MKILKPLALSALYRVVEHDNAFHLTVCGMLYVPLRADALPLTEIALWKELAPVLGEAPLDEVMPKGHAEVLVTGSVHAPGATPTLACSARMRLGAFEKALRVTGDRHWGADGVPTAPVPFTEMPLTWACSFGGEGFALNPIGKGFVPVTTPEGPSHPLPNFEDPARPLRSPDDRAPPAGFGALDARWAQRASRMGTYDDVWLREDFPGLPRDVEWTAFNTAPADQWIEGHWRGDEAYALENLHPTRPVIEGRLPGLIVRAFVDRARGGFAEVPLALDTVRFFPNIERVVLVFRGVTRVDEDDAADVRSLLLACERLGAPRPVEHYAAALARRNHPRTSGTALLDDSDLMPEGLSSGLAELLAGSPAPPSALDANMRRAAEAELAASRARLAANNIDPDKYLPASLPDPERAPTPAELPDHLDRIEAEAERHRAEAEAERERVMREVRATCEKNGVDLDRLLAENRAGGPPRFSGEAELGKFRQMIVEARAAGFDTTSVDAQLADPKLGERLRQAELAMLQGYRETAHEGEPAAPLGEEANARARRFVEDRRAARESMAAWDFTGADLSGMDLSGLDLHDALMERVKLHGCDLSRADLSGAVLARADLTGATLGHAKFRGANLGRAVLREARAEGPVDLRGATVDAVDLAGADLAAVNADGARWMNATLRDASLRGLSARGATFYQCDLAGARLAGARLEGATFLECDLTGADLSEADASGASFIECKAEGIRLRGARLDRARVVLKTGLERADLREARLTRATLREVSLAGASLADAHLDGADFTGSSLRGADLSRASGREARFVRADLSDAVLASSRMLHAVFQKATIAEADFTGANLFGADMIRVRGEPRSLEGASMGRVTATRRSRHG